MQRKYLILFSLSGLILSLDQFSKNWVSHYLAPGTTIPLLGGWLELVSLKNTGLAFGLIQRAPDSLRDIFFISVPVFALVLIVLIFIRLQDNDILSSVALTSLLSGAIGNLIDRIQYGYVLDFLRVNLGGTRWPALNLADCAILVGVGLMIWGGLRSETRSKWAN